MRICVISSLTFILTMVIYYLSSDDIRPRSIGDKIFRPTIIVLGVVEIITLSISLVVSFKGLYLRQGVNKEMQLLIFRRQVFFVIIRLMYAL